MSEKAKYPVQTTRRSFELIEAVVSLGGARLTTLAETLDLSVSTAHNHLSTLVECGYLLKEDDVYHVSLKFLEIGEVAKSRQAIVDAAHAEIDELATETGEVASLMTEENGQGVYLYSQKGDGAIPINIFPGKRLSLHSSASGKAILANLPDDRIEEIVDEIGLPAETENTITATDVLDEELTTIRERDIAFDNEEQISGLRCVAVPVRGTTGEVIGSIGVSGPAGRLKGGYLEDELPALLGSKSNIIELKLRYSG